MSNINLQKQDDTTNTNTSSINLNKETPVDNTNGNVEFGGAPGLGNVDLFADDTRFEKLDNAKAQLDNASEQVNNQLNDALNNVGEQVSGAFNSIGEQVSGFANNLNNQINNGPKEVTPDKLKLEPVVACILSIVLTGLGQMINGQLEKGLVILFGGMIVTFIVTLITCGIGAVIAPLIVAAAAIDAYKCAKLLQSGVALGKWEFHIFN